MHRLNQSFIATALTSFGFFCGAYLVSSWVVTAYVSAQASDMNSLAICLNDTENRLNCLRSTVSELLTDHTTQAVMEFISASSTNSTIAENCHAVGHIVGQTTYQNSGSIEGALALCSNDCRSACTHGVIGAGVMAEMGEEYPDDDVAHADKSELVAIGSHYCASNDPVCHAIGHLAYIITENEHDALAVCDEVAEGWLSEACYEGVFMERAGSSETTIFPFNPDKKPEVRTSNYTYPCLDMPGRYRHACFLLLTQFQEQLFEADGLTSNEDRLQKAKSVCESLSGRDREYCVEGIGQSSLVFGYHSLRSQDIQPFCNAFTTDSDRRACTLGVIPRFLYVANRGLYAYCENIPEEQRRELCYNATFQWTEARIRDIKNNTTRMCSNYAPCRARYESFMIRRDSLPEYRFGLSGRSM